ncbi:MAG: SDR family oxidoreductase [Candidatus Thiodiazotropha weberae]|uniref:NAD(P)-dependent oxidoreductase n=1 Tax=Candidatus Thiodiazotropha endoloripes TaxID=1818881 RepID=A0A1E2UPB5_9GAMM|nr:SDR family oxidoreductase [Candidatus Thiodiazotropha endoloripes]MCG7899908.1 SDR family oxidoreductase [Candidatus Thiodiazotropha weberae]MCG7901046.1 SDR family oxidoreductase [Candidatus Thiodiazotropha weberae]ODB84676.1 NAD(P)-dependent oxidoreductase [Candidatus Thiodiazotropha endoloripes]ODB90358.1 NAD(P)-dependent oxidoreductase [Candidatus Thiodiazotropha endoloripes]ODB96362.1 NAD(P)-dependent oxidoreductase [Candidatus Thiodiazotropha endoloripes]
MKKRVLITGASSGFGEACARRFSEAGDDLVLCARRMDRLQALSEELSGQSEVVIQTLDVTDPQAVEGFLDALPEASREIDVLVNNAGLALGLQPAHEADLQDWQTMVDTNIKGLMHMTRLILPGMVQRRRGHIINIGSVAGSWPYPGGNAYGATKAFVQQFSRGLKADLVGTPLRVTNIEPGLAETEFSLVRMKGDAQQAADVYQGTQPLTGPDIAEIVYWVTAVPPHVNINALEVMPVCQAWSPFAVDRTLGDDL